MPFRVLIPEFSTELLETNRQKLSPKLLYLSQPNQAPSLPLDPLLTQLQQSLQSAWDANPNHYLPVNAQAIGAAGAGIITLFQTALGIDGYTLTANITITPDNANTLTVNGDTAGPILQIMSPTLTAVFSVNGQELAIVLTIPAQDWTFTDTFTAFGNTYFSQLDFVSTDTVFPSFILTSLQHTVNGGQLQAGLNFSTQLNIQPPYSSLLQIVSAAPNPLPMLGPAQVSDPVTTSLNLAGALPTFSFSLPGMDTLAFNNPSFAIRGISTVYNAADYMRMDCLVKADITLNSYTLPLAARLPVGGSVPLLMLQPGKEVALTQITGFFAALFTGSVSGPLSLSLPTYISSLLSEFSLKGFVVELKQDWSGFTNISFAIESTNAEGTNLWPLMPGIFELKQAGIALNIYHGTGNSYVTTGSLWGSVEVGANLVLGAAIPLPIGSGQWTFTASANNAIPSLGQFAQFLGRTNLASLLPANLADVGGFALTNLTVVYDPTQQTLSSFTLQLDTNNAWTIINNWFVINTLSLHVNITMPLTSPQLTGNFTGMLVIGSVGMEVSVQRAAASADWMLTVLTTAVALPSLGDMTQLLGGSQLAELLPSSIVQNQFILENLDVGINISQQKMNRLTFLLDSPDEWIIITGLLSVRTPGVYFNLDWSTSSSPVITGKIYADLIFAGADFYVEANKNVLGWNLSATLSENSSLSLFSAVDAVISGASPQLAALGVPDIVLVTASISYATNDGSYDLEGTVDINDPVKNQPWSFNIGHTGVAIKGLGIRVTSHQGPNKAPVGTKVFIKGTLLIGSTVNFNIEYEVGGSLVIKGTLVGQGQLVSAKDLVSELCDPGAGNITWATGFESLDQIQLTNVQLNFVIGNSPSFQVYGTMLINGISVTAVFILTHETTWNFVLGIKVSMSPGWSIPGFTNTLSTFNLQQATFALVASSFDNAYTLPPAIGIPEVTSVAKGLNFYASFQISETDTRFQAAKAVLPTGTLPALTTLMIQGLITDPLAQSYVEVILSSSVVGVPLMGWDAVRLKKFSLRLYAEPSIALHGEFIMTMIQDDQGNYLVLAIDLKASLSEIAIVFIPNMPFPQRPVIIAWKNALGIIGLTFYLTDLELGIKPFAGPTLAGTLGGGVDFTSRQYSGTLLAHTGPNTIMAGALPDPVIVAELRKKPATQLLRSNGSTTFCDMLPASDLDRPMDSNIRVEGKVGFLIVPESPEPVIPNQIGLRLVNFTLPYMLNRFANITLPDVLFSILFPDVCFFVSFNPTNSSKVLDFEFNGQIVVYGFHGHIAALCNQNRIYLNADVDPVHFSVNGTDLLVIQRSAADAVNGPCVIIDSAPVKPADPNLSASLYCNFFNFIKMQCIALVKINQQQPADSYFYFDMQGNAGQLANMHLHLEYEKAKYLNVSGGFELFLDTNHIPGFNIINDTSNETVRAADALNLQKMPGQGVDLAASFTMILDNRNSAPNFTLQGSGSFWINIDPCHIKLDLNFTVSQVDANTLSHLPATIASQMAANAASIFTALYQSAECVVELIKLGVIVFNKAVEAAKLLAKFFKTSIEKGAKFLSDLGNAASDVAGWLWDVFDSKDSKKNTKALKDTTSYSDDDISKAVRESAGTAYTAAILVRDQAYAGYTATQATRALVYNFSQYSNDPIGGSLLLKVHYNYLQITPALYSVYPTQTSKAENMYSILQQVFSSSITAQQMADALALVYSAKDVAQALRTHYPSDTDTAAKMATLLMTAYQQALNPLQASDLAGVLASLYAVKDVAKVLKDNFPNDTGTPAAMVSILQTAYTAAGLPISAADMTGALANAPYAANLVVPILHTTYPNNTQTALQMAQLLYVAYASLQNSPGDMAVALDAGSYPLLGIAIALKTLYGAQVQHANQMATLLAQASVSPKESAPVLRELYPTDTDMPAKMITILLAAYTTTQITFGTMAIALAAAPYNAMSAAPALHAQYPQNTQTAADMITGLQSAYPNPAITVTVMVQALKACTYTVSDIASSIKQSYDTAVPHALQMAQLLAQAPAFSAAAVAPVLQIIYPADTNTAPLIAAVLALAPYVPSDVAPVIKQLFPMSAQAASDMYTLLVAAYAPTTITVDQMVAALVNATYTAPGTAPVLHANYASATSTPALMAALLNAAYSPQPVTAVMALALARSPYAVKDVALYLKSQIAYAADVNTATRMANVLYTAYQPSIVMADMIGALAATGFNAYESATPVKGLFTATTPSALATDLVASYQYSASLGMLTLGLALSSATVTPNDLVVAVNTALPATTAGEMAALLLVAYSTNITPGLTAAESVRAQGSNVITGGPLVTQSVAGISVPELAGALVSVFTPPNTIINDLSKALCKSYTNPTATAVASGIMSAFPSKTASALADTLTIGYAFIGQALSPDAMAAAVLAGLAYIGQQMSETALVQFLVSHYTSLTPALVAGAVVSAFGASNTTIVKVLAALTAGFATLTPLSATIALQQAFAVTQAIQVAQPVVQAFSLTQLPNHVGVISLAMLAAQFSLVATSGALGMIYPNWDANDFTILASVYNGATWGSLLQLVNEGNTAVQAAQSLKTTYPALQQGEMCPLLAAGFYLVHVNTSVVPMATAMKAAGYTLIQTSGAMGIQYQPNWTADDFDKVVQIYK
jgi:hypothetical protein